MASSETEDAPKSLGDILTEELDGAVGSGSTHGEPLPVQQDKLKAVYARIHALKPGRSALCLSGGGIRSASFGLGVLQELARRELLGKFDFLSTVSGGGYVGGWLSAWIKNHPRGRDGVFEELKTRPDLTLMPEREPVRHLRAYSNYLTPHLGIFSADLWTLIATFLRNMLLNWFVLLSWLAAAMMVPRFLLAAIPLQPAPWLLNSLLTGGAAFIVMAMAYALLDQPCAGNAGWPQRRFLIFRQIPLMLASLCITLWWAGMCTVHGQDRAAFLKTSEGIPAFCLFLICTYLGGGLVVDLVNGFLNKKPRKFSPLPWINRILSVLVTTAVGGLALWLIAIKFFPDPAASARRYVCFAPAMILMVFLLVNFLFAGLASRVSEDEDREWWGRSAGWLLVTIVAWVAGSTLVIFGPFVFTWQNVVTKAVLGAAGGFAGLATAAFGLSSRSAAKQSGHPHPLAQLLPTAAAIAFFLLLSLGISWALDGSTALSFRVGEIYANPQYDKPGSPVALAAGRPVEKVAPWTQRYRKQVADDLLFTLGMLAAGITMGFFINPNKFSLHAVYRQRLIRAFLGASRMPGTRKPHAFTGFDPKDDFKIAELGGTKPFHVVNIALNLVKGKQLAWQERKAASFTVSPLHSGSWRLGYRPSAEYGAGISLGTAMAISGAAASPNMGYHSSPLIAFLMTLFNVRLGWWSGNPAASTWRRSGPTYAAGPIFAEAAGNTSDSYRYVNLSDGGHFENLGIYEMVLRRCRHIVVVDAGCDADYVFEDLGNAIRKIRIDLGVPIDIRVVSPKKAGAQLSYFALGTIHYSEIDGPGTDGELLYLKPVMCGDEPADISHYASAHPEFPHEPTSDQWFSESQLESYRALGSHAAETICRSAGEVASLAEFFAKLKTGTTPAPPPAAEGSLASKPPVFPSEAGA